MFSYTEELESPQFPVLVSQYRYQPGVACVTTDQVLVAGSAPSYPSSYLINVKRKTVYKTVLTMSVGV